jgi:regulator of sigma E protease
MRMGKIASVRDDSPASRAGLQPEDIIDRVEVADANDGVTRYVTSRSKGPLHAGLTEVDLDPLRLRFDLRNWALAQHSKNRKPVELTVLRTNASNPVNHSERQELRLKIEWDENWQFENESPASVNSPFSIPELGLAYRVETRVEGVAPGSPAAAARVDKAAEIKFKAGDVIRRNGAIVAAHEGDSVQLQPGDQLNLVPGDVIKSCRFLVHGPRPDSNPKPGEWQEIKPDQWAYVFYVLQQEADYKQISVLLERDHLELTLEAVEDKTWPEVRRGLWLASDKRLQKADSFGEALTLGLQETGNFIGQIYQNLRGIITRRVSPKNFGGPIAIFTMAYRIAQDPYRFLLFLGIISVNLAVINFLPIPVLDGGHMVFLVYEKVRGKPAPKRVLEAATYAGLAFIVLLMISVIYLDLSRL